MWGHSTWYLDLHYVNYVALFSTRRHTVLLIIILTDSLIASDSAGCLCVYVYVYVYVCVCKKEKERERERESIFTLLFPFRLSSQNGRRKAGGALSTTTHIHKLCGGLIATVLCVSIYIYECEFKCWDMMHQVCVPGGHAQLWHLMKSADLNKRKISSNLKIFTTIFL